MKVLVACFPRLIWVEKHTSCVQMPKTEVSQSGCENIVIASTSCWLACDPDVPSSNVSSDYPPRGSLKVDNYPKWNTEDSQIAVGVKSFRAKFPFNIYIKPVHFFLGPCLHSGERSQAQRLQALRKSKIVPSPDILQMGIIWPWIQWHSDDLFLNFDESSSLQH